MTRRTGGRNGSRSGGAGRSLAAGIVVACALVQPARADEIAVLSAAAVQVPLTESAAAFEQATGHKVRLEFATAGGVEAKVKAGARPALVINARERLEAMAADKLVAGAAPRTLGVVRMGVAARKGARKPDLGSVEGFKASLLAAESIAYGDPARGSTTGIYFAKLIERLGLADALRPKSRLAANGLDVMKLVAAGEAELGVTQISEILHGQADTLVGPLPESLQLATTYAITFSSDSPGPAARAFVEALTEGAGRERFVHAGFE